ncbi:LPA [Branchiostoma lanceolatum]|uniref:LPA protein n=1 Tax=Branchiostoma lanceolatum TaxID=7740 RepID=A0A8K0EM70_BRALA|nr:LPA [Branchiostoma lanceolatum]
MQESQTDWTYLAHMSATKPNSLYVPGAGRKGSYDVHNGGKKKKCCKIRKKLLKVIVLVFNVTMVILLAYFAEKSAFPTSSSSMEQMGTPYSARSPGSEMNVGLHGSTSQPGNPEEGYSPSRELCQEGAGTSYRGTVSVTETGKTCQRWDSQTPHWHSRKPADYPSSGLEENYCRNPDGDSGVWCFTMDPSKRWERCDVPVCGSLERSPDWAIESTITPYPDSTGPDKVLDGYHYSIWNPKAGERPWYIIFDFGVPYNLSKIGVTNYGDTTHDISTFQFQTSEKRETETREANMSAESSSDPYNWEDVLTVTDVAAATCDTQVFGGFSATGRFWKLNITRTHGTSRWQPWLREVNFFGERAGPAAESLPK